jgi:C-terminal processing protease CtpA/Prc
VLAIGIAVGALTFSDAKPGASSSSGTSRAGTGSDYARMIDGLSATLELEVQERQRLEDEVQTLSGQVAQLRQKLGDARGTDLTAATASQPEPAPEPDEDAPGDDGAITPFLDAGFDPARAQYVKQLQDELSLQRLYLRDQAEREGWLRTPRYRDAMQAINDREVNLAQELGEDDYDRYLYAIGRPNRVLVGDVLANGPAQQAGIEVGDAILSYGGERIFDAGTLVNATRSGSAGMSTAIEIEREGQTQLVYVPRGPLGINLRVARVKPGP